MTAGRAPTAVVVGGGPAGLMAAEVLANEGLAVTVCDAKPSLGRKLLMAGKSGLNLTKAEPLQEFCLAYGDAADWLAPMLLEFGPEQVQAWARDLGQSLFVGSTKRVFPDVMKASPLLRAWIGRLQSAGVQFETRWRWTGWAGGSPRFETPEGNKSLPCDVCVLALGGASWSRLGSDGAWARVLGKRGVECAPFAPSNVGVAVHWSSFMDKVMGAPLKGVALRAGALVSRGEVILSKRGIEGGGIYPLTPALREGAALSVDLLPDLTTDEIAERLSRPRGKASLSNHLRKTLKLPPSKLALLNECGRPVPTDPHQLAARMKSLEIATGGLRPMDEAISTAGGVTHSSVTEGLMLRDVPGVFCAGEMLDWEAPTGGYLLTACFATGRWAGHAAARYALEELEGGA